MEYEGGGGSGAGAEDGRPVMASTLNGSSPFVFGQALSSSASDAKSGASGGASKGAAEVKVKPSGSEVSSVKPSPATIQHHLHEIRQDLRNRTLASAASSTSRYISGGPGGGSRQAGSLSALSSPRRPSVSSSSASPTKLDRRGGGFEGATDSRVLSFSGGAGGGGAGGGGGSSGNGGLLISDPAVGNASAKTSSSSPARGGGGVWDGSVRDFSAAETAANVVGASKPNMADSHSHCGGDETFGRTSPSSSAGEADRRVSSLAAPPSASSAGCVGLNSQGATQLFRITQELLAFSSILDESRTKAVEEVNRLRLQKDNLESMLQASCNREQVNLAEVQKQREMLSQWQERFTSLKGQATTTLRQLEESRDAVKAKLQMSAADCEKYQHELQQMERQRERERQELLNLQEIKSRFTEATSENQELQREVESLRHDNFQLQNSINQLSTEKNQLLGRVDELETQSRKADFCSELRRRYSQEGTGHLTGTSRGELSPLTRGAGSAQQQTGSEANEGGQLEAEDVVQAFVESAEDERLEQFRELVDKYREEAVERKKMEEYAYALLVELERVEGESTCVPPKEEQRQDVENEMERVEAAVVT